MKLSSQDMGYEKELKHFISQESSPKDTHEYFINALTVFTMLDSLKKGKALSIEETT